MTSACGEVPARSGREPSREPDRRPARQEPASEMYAIVKTGGKQYKVAVGDVVDVELLDGDSVDLQPMLVVDGSTVTSSADDLAKVSITGEVLGETKGPKIKILKYKNKTGYKQASGPPPALQPGRDHRHLEVRGARRHGTQEGCVQLPQRSRLERPAAGREALRRPGRQGRRDPRPPARHEVPPRRRRRPRRGRHAVRAGRGRGRVRHKAGRKNVNIVPVAEA